MLDTTFNINQTHFVEKIRNISEINEKVIRQWKTPVVEFMLEQSEEEIIEAYENDLFDTPVNPKLNPRELISIVTTRRDWTRSSLLELKTITQNWITKTSSTWTDNVPPFYSVELEYIVSRL